MSKSSDNYYTPSTYIESSRIAMGSIELDPCSSELANETIKADVIYTLEDSMFNHHLICDSLWFNPPYSDPLPFVSKVAYEYKIGNTKQICGLLNLDCSTKWFQEVAAISTAFCFLRKRIQFFKANDEQTVITGTCQNNKCQFIFYAGYRTDEFIKEFNRYGLCMKNDIVIERPLVEFFE
jgi:hypothetical protein